MTKDKIDLNELGVAGKEKFSVWADISAEKLAETRTVSKSENHPTSNASYGFAIWQSIFEVHVNKLPKVSSTHRA